MIKDSEIQQGVMGTPLKAPSDPPVLTVVASDYGYEPLKSTQRHGPF